MRPLYLILFLAGTILPVVCFTQHFYDGHADDWPKFWSAPFESWVISGFSWDLIVTATTATAFMIAESRRLGMRWVFLHILLVFAVGMSSSLPLFMFRREGRLRQEPTTESESGK